MKIHFGLPSCNYNIVLNKEDLEQLLSKGSLCIHVSRVGCTTSRACVNKEGNGLDILDKKEVYNDLRFYLDEPIADLEGGDWCVQYLDIILDESCGFERNRKEEKT